MAEHQTGMLAELFGARFADLPGIEPVLGQRGWLGGLWGSEVRTGSHCRRMAGVESGAASVTSRP